MAERTGYFEFPCGEVALGFQPFLVADSSCENLIREWSGPGCPRSSDDISVAGGGGGVLVAEDDGNVG